ncbi:LOB domain-containing protein 29-like [Ananas comosus]|uniref:LOB domain-containing protein 29-like n=1 Tax=Ananas comosus TaxID=4615 RepID=A0A6P5HBS3_ANACO|nr:LOB domain-containing protein 29-like [Ananas comosus]
MAGFGSPCGACKFLRRKCVRGCVFAPYFAHEQGAAHFAAIHKVFGASNVSKLLMHLPVGDRCEAAVTIAYEAQARLRDPIYGCVAHIFALQQQVVNLQAELSSLVAQAAQSRGHEQGFLFPPDGDLRMPQPSVSNDRENIFIDNNGLLDSTTFYDSRACNGTQWFANGDHVSLDMDDKSYCTMGEDLRSVAFGYINGH